MSDARNRTNAAWLRAQLDDLAAHVVLCSTPLTPADIRSALLGIKAGVGWRVWMGRLREANAQLRRVLGR